MPNWGADNLDIAQSIAAEEFKIGDESVVVEVVEFEHTSEDLERFSANSKAPKDLDEAINRSLPAASLVMKKLMELPEKPSEVEVSFGLKLSGKVGAIIASTAVEGNFGVKMKWTKPKDPNGTS